MPTGSAVQATTTKPVPNLVTRDVLEVLDAHGIRPELVETGAASTTLRFDHDTLERLFRKLGGRH